MISKEIFDSLMADITSTPDNSPEWSDMLIDPKIFKLLRPNESPSDISSVMIVKIRNNSKALFISGDGDHLNFSVLNKSYSGDYYTYPDTFNDTLKSFDETNAIIKKHFNDQELYFLGKEIIAGSFNMIKLTYPKLYKAILGFKLVQTNQVSTLCVGYDKKSKKIELMYNPSFVAEGSLFEFIQNARSSSSNNDLSALTVNDLNDFLTSIGSFYFMHEAYHVIYRHVSDQLSEYDTKLPHDIENIIEDSYINNRLVTTYNSNLRILKVMSKMGKSLDIYNGITSIYTVSGKPSKFLLRTKSAHDDIDQYNREHDTYYTGFKGYIRSQPVNLFDYGYDDESYNELGKFFDESLDKNSTVDITCLGKTSNNTYNNYRVDYTNVINTFLNLNPEDKHDSPKITTQGNGPDSPQNSQQNEQTPGDQGQSSQSQDGQSSSQSQSGQSSNQIDQSQSQDGQSSDQGNQSQSQSGQSSQGNPQSNQSNSSSSQGQTQQGSQQGNGNDQSTTRSQSGQDTQSSSDQNNGQQNASLGSSPMSTNSNNNSQSTQQSPTRAGAGSKSINSKPKDPSNPMDSIHDIPDSIDSTLKDAADEIVNSIFSEGNGGFSKSGAVDSSILDIAKGESRNKVAKNWKSTLKHMIQNATGVEIQYNPDAPNSRIEGQLGRETIDTKLSTMILSFDVSGSMSIEDFKSALVYIDDLLKMNLKFDKIGLIYWSWSTDATIKPKRFNQRRGIYQLAKTNYPGSGGGTRISKSFEPFVSGELKSVKPDLMIIFTDGDFSSPDDDKILRWIKRYSRKILWVLTPNGTERYITRFDKTSKNRIIKMKSR